MGVIKLEPRCPKSVNGVSFDPNPNWSFDDLLSELNSLQLKIDASGSPLNVPPFIKSPLRGIRGAGKREKNEAKAFVMRVADDEFDLSDDEDDIESKSLVPAGRFACDDLFLSDSDNSEDEAMQPLQVAFIDKTNMVEGAFIELTHEHQLGIKEEIRNQLASLETRLVTGKEKSTSGLAQVEKMSDARREKERKQDMQYQRMIAEALDNHLTAIQRDHEHQSQIEERKIRNDAAIEEATRKEKALLEEKMRQQKAKAEEELKARLEAARKEDERKAAEEAERANQAADQLAKERSETIPTSTAQNVLSTTLVPKDVPSAGNLVRAAEIALKLEERRLQNYKTLEEQNQSIISGSNMDVRSKEREIARRIKQIGGSIESVRSKVTELVKIFNDPVFPQTVTAAMFAKKVISIFETPNANLNSSAFACGHVIVYVSAQVPAVMDCLLAEFHKACMYTVPKHIVYKKIAFETKESYFKAIGYREEDGKLESTDNYLERLQSCMKLYGALVQTEAQGTQNMHGLEAGWVWLARFLNFLPANVYSAAALEAFLQMAGYALHRKYKLQFRKILNAIVQQFVQALRTRADSHATTVITRLQNYIESKEFLQEPKGWRLEGALLSHSMIPDDENPPPPDIRHAHTVLY